MYNLKAEHLLRDDDFIERQAKIYAALKSAGIALQLSKDFSHFLFYQAVDWIAGRKEDRGMSEKEIYESAVKNSKKPDNLKQWGELINERDYCIDYIDTLEAELAEYRKKL